MAVLVCVLIFAAGFLFADYLNAKQPIRSVAGHQPRPLNREPLPPPSVGSGVRRPECFICGNEPQTTARPKDGGSI